MILRIDDSRCIVWRSPTTLQFGLGRDAVVIDGVDAVDERLVSALLAGTTRGALAVLASIAGGTAADAERLITALAPVLLPERTPAPPPRLAIDGRGPTAERIAELAARAGIPVVLDPDAADLAVVVGRFSIPPARYARWLGRDVDHLAIVHGERTTTIGPFVRPGAGPCLYCLDRARTDADPVWPVLATQLEGRPTAQESGALVEEIAALAVRIVRAHHDSPTDPLVDRSLEISASPIPVVRRHRVHPDCGCRSPRGNATVPSASSNARRTPPTTDEAADVPA